MKAPLILLAALLFSASCERHEWKDADGEGTRKLYPSHEEHGENAGHGESHGEKAEGHGEHEAEVHEGQ